METKQLTEALKALHTALIDRSRIAFERLYGRVSSGQLLQLVAHDWFFAWLRPVSSLIAEIDAGAIDAVSARQQVGALLDTEAKTAFAEEYLTALQEPAVALAHLGVKLALDTDADTGAKIPTPLRGEAQ